MAEHDKPESGYVGEPEPTCRWCNRQFTWCEESPDGRHDAVRHGGLDDATVDELPDDDRD